MENLNYFSGLCYVLAIVAVLTRILMLFCKDAWIRWEMNKAYTEKQPKWIYIVVLLSIGLAFYTWYKVYVSSLEYGWIIATILTVTLLKGFTLILNYEAFRRFAKYVLYDSKRMVILNTVVLILAAIFVLMGIYLY
ncbi:hypothetical protein [Haloplasma contractile]|uniref:Uncharacterized protein n=1 Tax=Haloplasma contractile SSD-17B TaxID=1033810 RepID=U2DTI8_9MOLU|nr:hypothetical protein [Haloplasma contractile]ERJ11797.1 hypothetical protein HLPCO_002036 [Haloplasma contractile SSD-17B]